MRAHWRWDSPLVLAAAGTLAIHAICLVVADAVVVSQPLRTVTPAPRVELVDVELAPPAPPPPPPAPVPAPPAAQVQHPIASKAPPAAAPVDPHTATAPPPPIDPEAQPAPQAEPVLPMPDLAPSAIGSGSGSGSGSGTTPMSIAAIKQPALPHGDYSYFHAKDYPVEATRLGIEGELRVKLIVNERGKVVSRMLLDHLGYGLDELALARAALIEFTPARDSDDRPVTSVVVWTFQMTVPK